MFRRCVLGVSRASLLKYNDKYEGSASGVCVCVFRCMFCQSRTSLEVGHAKKMQTHVQINMFMLQMLLRVLKQYHKVLPFSKCLLVGMLFTTARASIITVQEASLKNTALGKDT